ncbi:hypothetical protein EDD19_1238 [Dietzia cinnamea]|uniref:Uncharacterized protein n=1 Tax=Dietzia cinnamea TaxID=321318 RepID=A0A4R3ZPG0_9ACTN|nr:hypothetical protein EDD19_1238 [Dietzia cinnamea]
MWATLVDRGGSRYRPKESPDRNEKKTLRHVARHADTWHSFVDVETYRHGSEVLARHCADDGRDPAEIERSTEIGGPSTPDEARRMADALHPEGPASADPDSG